MADRLLAALRGRKDAKFRLVMPDDAQWRDLVAEMVAEAELVRIEGIPWERSDMGRGFLKMPELTLEEWQFFSAGLLPLPAPVTWFEYDMPFSPWDANGNPVPHHVVGKRQRSATLISALEPGRLYFMRFDETLTEDENGVAHPSLFSTGAVLEKPMHAYNPDAPLPPMQDGFDCKMHDRFGWQMKMRDQWVRAASGEALQMGDVVGTDVAIGVYCLLMVNSQSTQTDRVDPPAKLNRARQRRGKLPLASHRVCHIVPPKTYADRTAAMDSGRRPPRLHWRRSHLRRYRSGRVVVIPRALVGKASDEVVTHEYRVRAT